MYLKILLIIFLSLSYQVAYSKALKVLAFRDNHSEAVKSRLAEFEKTRGVKVQLDLIASSTVATKIMTDQMAGGSYDLYTVDEPFIPKLSPFFLKYKDWPKAEKSLNSDFLTAALAGTSFAGSSFGLPVNSNIYMYVYRKDLFEDPKEKHNFLNRYHYPLSQPKNIREMRDIAEFFTRPPRLYGFAPFTKKSEGTTIEAIWILSSFEVKLFDAELNVIMDEDKARSAFAFYKKLMKFAPVGSKSWHHSERMAAYKKGKVVQILTWPGFLPGIENPKRSLVIGKSGWGVPPGRAVVGTWTLAIPKSSNKKALAADFAHHWTSESFGKKLVPYGMNPSRSALLADPELNAKNPWFEALLKSFEKGTVRPRFPEYKKVSDNISNHFTNMLIGNLTPEQCAKNLKRDLTKLAAEVRKAQMAKASAEEKL